MPNVIHLLEAVSHKVTVARDGQQVTVLIDRVRGGYDGDSVTFLHAYKGESVVLDEASVSAAMLAAFGRPVVEAKKEPA